MSDGENNKTLVRRFIQALDTDELGILDEICTPEVAMEWRNGIPPANLSATTILRYGRWWPKQSTS